MKQYSIVICDLDGTLIETASGKTFPEGSWDCQLKMDVWEALKKLGPRDIAICSNQGGIDRGFVKQGPFNGKINYIASALSEYVGCNVLYDYCISNDPLCPRRKPNTGMFEEALQKIKQRRYETSSIPLSDVLSIGDASGLPGQFSSSDLAAAKAFGCDYMDVNEFVKSMNDYYL